MQSARNQYHAKNSARVSFVTFVRSATVITVLATESECDRTEHWPGVHVAAESTSQRQRHDDQDAEPGHLVHHRSIIVKKHLIVSLTLTSDIVASTHK